MTVVLFLAAGFCLLLLVLYLFLLSVPSTEHSARPAQAEETLRTLSFEFPSQLLGERICSRQDLDFVATEAHDLQQKFLRERKAVMFFWLKDVRNSVVQVVDFYRTAVRTSASVNPVVEIRLATNYVAFLLLWEIARGLVWIQNPVAAQRIISRVFGIADQLSLATGGLLTALDPSVLGRVKPPWQTPSQKA